MAETTFQMERIRRLLLIGGLAGLGLLVYTTIHPFIASLTWAIILALSLWPVFRGLRKRIPAPGWVSPLVMVCIITLCIVVPLGVAGLLFVGEAQTLVEDVRGAVMGEKGDLAGSLSAIPFIGEVLKEKLVLLRAHPEEFERILDEHRQPLLQFATKATGDIVRVLAQLMICLFAGYFLFRHGETLAEQARRAVNRLGGPRLETIFSDIKGTVRGVVYGLVMTALAQACLAAIGFFVAGVPYPLLLAMLTFVVSFIPFGPPLVWAPAAIATLVDGRVGWGVFLLIWGAGVISMIDNILRPLLIGQATRMPVLLVFLGVLGGVLSYGMVGLFVGPVVMAVALALWRDWVARRDEMRGAATPDAVITAEPAETA